MITKDQALELTPSGWTYEHDTGCFVGRALEEWLSTVALEHGLGLLKGGSFR